MIHRPVGLIGRIFSILLLAILIEYGASTFFFERSSQVSVRDEEARRLAEHVVIARKLIADAPRADREGLAEDLTTERYSIRWRAQLPPALHIAPTLDRIHRQVAQWEPNLENAGLRLRLVGRTRDAVIVGAVSLPDGTWMEFATRQPLHELTFAWERVLMGLAPAVAIILIGGLLVRQTLLPMRRLAVAAELVGAGRGSAVLAPVPEAGPREMRNVTAAFNRMQERIHRLIEERTEALAAVGHDLRTPLSRLMLRADAVPDDALRTTIGNDVAEMQAMVDSLLAYLGGEEEVEPRRSCDLAVLCATMADEAADHGGDVRYHGPDHCERAVRRTGLRRAIANLVDNALHYGTRARIVLEEDDDGSVSISVKDDGPGIPDEQIERVLQPFVRLDRARARDTVGLGLGLAIVSRAVEEEGGTLTLSNRPQGGLCAQIRLPPVAD